MRTERLGDVADLSWGDTSTTKASYVDSGFPAYSASGPDGYLPYADHTRVGVVLSAIGADCGKTWLAKGAWSCIKNTIRFWSVDADVDTEYLYWLTRDPAFWPRRGSAQPFISQGDARNVFVTLPSLPEQKAIAGVLGVLDDKIALNRKMSATLEAMARALFKSWFVDFDPVRAKAEGRDPGLSPEIAALFPDSFQDSELGEIPRGWQVRGLDEVARFLNGLALQKYPPVNGRSLPVIKIAQLRAGHTTSADLASAQLDPEYIVSDGDVLFSWSGSLECVLWTGGAGALNQHLFKVTSASFPKWFYFLWIHHRLEDFRHIAAGKATTMGHIQRHHLSDAKAVVPSSNALKSADSVLSSLIERLMMARLESRTLAHIRDALVPKLISGEIRVTDAERVVEKSA